MLIQTIYYHLLPVSDLYDVINIKEADIIIGKMRLLDGEILKNKTYMDRWFRYYCETDNLRLQGDFEIAGLPLCGKIYRSEILKLAVHGKNTREFPAISCGEDMLLSIIIFLKSQKIFIMGKVIYHHRVNYKSLSHNISNKRVIEYLLVSLNIWKLFPYYNYFKLAELGGTILNHYEDAFF